MTASATALLIVLSANDPVSISNNCETTIIAYIVGLCYAICSGFWLLICSCVSCDKSLICWMMSAARAVVPIVALLLLGAVFIACALALIPYITNQKLEKVISILFSLCWQFWKYNLRANCDSVQSTFSQLYRHKWRQKTAAWHNFDFFIDLTFVFLSNG